MRGGGAGEADEVVAAFEYRDDAALCVCLGDFHEPRGHPGEILLDERETAKRIEAMRVEPGRDHDQIRAKRIDRRQERRLQRLPEYLAVRAGPERSVDDIIVLAALVA